MRTQKNIEKNVGKSSYKNAERSSGKHIFSSSNTMARRKKRLWTIDEDNKLVEYVKKYGERNWSNVQRVTGLTRTGKSCRLRWRDQLHPDLNKQPFSSEEEKLIGDLQSQVGNKWSIIADFMPGRTDNAIKNYWYNRCKRYRGTTSLPNEQGTSSSETVSSSFKANEQDLSPEWIPNSDLSRLHHLPSTGMLNPEGFELSSIQHVEMPRGFSYKSGLPFFPLESLHAMSNFYSPATNMLRFMEQMYGLDLVNTVSSFGPISTDRELIVEQSDGYAFPECNKALVDPLLTEGDIVDMWLNESRDQESVFQDAMCADGAAIGNTSAATTTDDVNVLPAWLNSPGLDEFLAREPISQHTLIAEDGAINNVFAATEEPGSCFNSSVPNEFLGQESISQTVGCENCGNMTDAAFVNEPPFWFNSPGMDDFLIQEPIFADAVLCADYGATDDFAASSTSYVTNYGWDDETSDFWSTPFVTQIA